jgi:hypothetical protein
MLIALAVVATVILAASAIAAPAEKPTPHSVLVQSPSDAQNQTTPSAAARQITKHPQAMAASQMEQPVVHAQRVIRQPRRMYYRSPPRKKQSFFDKLMEVERRKNAWLKKTFLGL